MTTAQFKYLANLDMDAVEQPQVDAISKYADLWLQDVAPNQPMRMDQTTLTRELARIDSVAPKSRGRRSEVEEPAFRSLGREKTFLATSASTSCAE
jgi:hypothetical protein